MQQVQHSGEPQRRRKGISVSLTPDKKNNHVPQQGTPKNESVRLGQSFVHFEQQPVYPQYVRVFSSTNPPNPHVRFNYSNVSQDHQARESQALNQELCILKREIQAKRSVVESLQQNHIQLQTSSVRPIYSIPKDPEVINNHKSNRCQQPTQPRPEMQVPLRPTFQSPEKQKPGITSLKLPANQTVVASLVVPAPEINNYNVHQITNNPKTTSLPVTKEQPNILVSTEKAEGGGAKRTEKKQQEVQTEEKTEKNVIQREVGKRSPVKKIEDNKQNEKNQKQRLQRLRWAEQKLLDIIKVCERGM